MLYEIIRLVSAVTQSNCSDKGRISPAVVILVDKELCVFDYILKHLVVTVCHSKH